MMPPSHGGCRGFESLRAHFKKMKEWRLLRIMEADSAMQMAIDEAITTARSQNRVPNTLRFYIWNPPTISLGYGQQIDKLNFDKVKEKGFGYVRRITGGTAVLHKNDLTYAIITSELDIPSNVVESYKELSKGLVLGLIRLGLDAEHKLTIDPEKDRTASCYSNENEYDVVVNGKKISGNAQRRLNGAVLQHGTIIIEDNIEELFDCLKYANKAELIEQTRQKLTCIQNELGRKLSPQELEEKLILGFEQMGIKLVQGELTDYEKELADALYRKRYSTDEWNHKR